jgi:dimethylhistidine N-methyltransferase
LQEFRADVLSGLARKQKCVPSKYFYDDEGSRLFEEICSLPEYYPTRTERALLHDLVPELASLVEPDTALVEFGSGSATKTRILLDGADGIKTYVPVEICEEWVQACADKLKRDYPGLSVHPVVGDFTAPLDLHGVLNGAARLGFFPGSTIGNLAEEEAQAFLENARATLGDDGRLLIGIDLRKDVDTLIAAYDDAAGVTRAFNRNMLVRINRELEGDFDPRSFRHRAVWNAGDSRIEMHLQSRLDQKVRVAGAEFAFEEGETIHTENSHKYTVEGFAALAARAGWRLSRQWVSPPPCFAVLLLE